MYMHVADMQQGPALSNRGDGKPEQESVPEGGWLKLQPHEQLPFAQGIQQVVNVPVVSTTAL